MIRVAAVDLIPGFPAAAARTDHLEYGRWKPIRLGGFVHMVRRNHAPRSVHVLNNDSRITGNVLSDLARDRPRIEIIAATRGKP